ncbi:MAG: T9SS type A sorting domain-containing protein [Saprospiraceae bacterium]|nr:T9SS type A sorting domain-containing protein [Saprospiraceae bacterium]
MIYWVTINLFVLLSIRVFSSRKQVRSKWLYPYGCALFFLTFSNPVSNGGSVNQQTDTIDRLLQLDDNQFLEEIQKATFKYFWDFGHPQSGLARERNTSGDLVTSGGSGFGIMAIIVGIHRNFITRQEGQARLQKIVAFLSAADRFHGAWSHWINGNSGKVIPFSLKDNGGDLVETAFLIQGLLTARAYFDLDTPEEIQLRSDITALWEGVDWNWYRKQVNQVLNWHWSPNYGFEINLTIRGWNETMITYILGIASPTHTLPTSMYAKGWASNNYLNGRTFYGYKLEVGNGTGGPLFFTHYSFLGLDPRNKRDAYANYFFQAQNQTLINRAWCIDNPNQYLGYGPDCWGLTASDDPNGYKAHAPNENADNGTITPSASISSIAYTPAESIAAARSFLETYREKVWGPMGFYDAFNPTLNWYADSYLAIDQGPIICMIENYRSGLLWDYFMRNQEINDALSRIGFIEDNSTTAVEQFESDIIIFPNPAKQGFYIQNKNHDLNELKLFDQSGKEVLFKAVPDSEVIHVELADRLGVGMYYLFFKADHHNYVKKIILNP